MPPRYVDIVLTGGGGTRPDPLHISLRGKDWVVWRCAKPFKIVRMERQAHLPGRCSAPTNPFFRTFPTGDWRRRVSSRRVRRSAVCHVYKAVIRVKGRARPIDPHVIVDP